MTDSRAPSRSPDASARARAFAVHLLTASGAALAFLALLEAVREHWAMMFVWLGAALLVDGIDGPLARRFDVVDVLPNWSGAILDLVVDFLNYVVVPAFAIVAGGFMRPSLALAAAAAIVISSAIYFADSRMKTDDDYFRGFPATWNLVAFYFFLLHPNEWAALAAIAVLVVCTFIPFVFVHPMRVRRLRILNIILCAAWGILAGFTLARDFAPPSWVMYALTALALYFLIAGLSRLGNKS